MMTHYADALLAIAACTLTLVVFYGPWQDACTDWARQRIFEARDELFDIAQSGRISFESAEYRTIRISLEGLIRYAHELSMINLIWHVAFRPAAGRSRLHDALDRVEDDALRSEVKMLTDRAQNALLIMIGMKSVFGLVALAVSHISKPFKIRAGRAAKAYADDIQREAELSAC